MVFIKYLLVLTSLIFILYWSLQKASLRTQNVLLLLSSYIFYGIWDLRFLVLLLLSSIVDFIIGIKLGKKESIKSRKKLLWLSIIVNLGILGFFKYYDFFITTLSETLSLIGLNANISTLELLLPLGISFYTFKKLSYTIDIYNGKIKPTYDAVAFFAFIAFFPQMIAGPIDRGSTLLPQFLKKRSFSYSMVRDGLRQILAGLVKKMVIADNLNPIVEDIFRNYTSYDGFSITIGIFFAAMQLYFDFSGYSDIAIGIGKLFGFDLMKNFSVPYFSRDIAEFWRRWHISLSTWIRDYIYVPLCGNRPSRRKKGFYIVVTFTLCGLWHGAAWTFVFWGFLHGLYFLPMTLKKRHPRFIGVPAKGKIFPSFHEGSRMFLTFVTVSIAWVFFMSNSFKQAFGLLGRIFTHPFLQLNYLDFLPMIFACFILLLIEWFQREKDFFLQIDYLPLVARWGIYYALIFIILIFGLSGGTEFIYAQF